jgi:hypothetical protein
MRKEKNAARIINYVKGRVNRRPEVRDTLNREIFIARITDLASKFLPADRQYLPLLEFT